MSMKVPLLDLKAQYQTIQDEILAEIAEVCESQYFIGGPKVEALESAVAKYSGTRYAVGVSSGTDALLAVLMAMGVGPGDAVLTTPYTFFATGGSIVRVGATPIFVDIDPRTFNMDPQACRRVLEHRPQRFAKLNWKVLMPVHLYGQSAEMGSLLDLAREHNLKVVEDAAQAIGAEYLLEAERRKAGSMGDAGCFSFFPSKNLGGFGDGGMVVTHDGALAEQVSLLRNHGAKPKYYHRVVGGNFRLDAIQAAVLSVKLKHLEAWHAARRKNAERYDRTLGRAGVITPEAVHKDARLKNYHIYNQYVIRVPHRDEVREALAAVGVGSEIYYPVPLHLQECFKNLGYGDGEMPESERAARETIALPIYPELTDEMLDYAAQGVIDALAGLKTRAKH
jgi:dTDP-4-amino-4,6-dideoxygalactose transaminase